MNSDRSTYVLIPGAWQGAWSWQPVARRLRAAGRAAVTLTLPGLADGDARTGLHLADATGHVVSVIDDRDLRDVVLVGQSWGGYPLTAAAHQVAERVSRIVYYNAIVPRRGVPLIDENADYRQMLRAAIAASPDGSVAVVPEQVPLLLPDSSEETRRLFFDLLVPHPGTYFTEAIDVDDVTGLGVPVDYLLSENDLALARPGTELAARIGRTPRMLPGGHESMLTHPDAVAEALLT
ncbi:alpha/beta fold hydrolase [Actinoplanes sp. NPDC049265]|uniref:alpha/beta fold hydrolase n=1 Tax=Actinoplanes sp. NPDC049265 TaxID=3363902 RepID=UPI003719D0FC